MKIFGEGQIPSLMKRIDRVGQEFQEDCVRIQAESNYRDNPRDIICKAISWETITGQLDQSAVRAFFLFYNAECWASYTPPNTPPGNNRYDTITFTFYSNLELPMMHRTTSLDEM